MIIIINLHIHTDYSDGIYPVEYILKIVDSHDIEYFSITDHDSVKAYYEIINNEKLIYGVELSAQYEKGLCHILGYGIDLEMINSFCEEVIKSRIEKGEKILLEIQRLGYDIDKDDFQTKTGIIGKRDIINSLLEKKYFSSYEDASNIMKKFNFKTNKPSIEECIDIIKQAGGISVLAHPWTLNLDMNGLKNFILKNRIEGIEVFNHNIDKNLYYRLNDLANELDLYKTCGTDFHGYRKYDSLIVKENVDCSKILKKLIDKRR